MKRYYGDCPNCGGLIELASDGKYYCESCGTAYAPDFDKQEVDEEKKAAEPKLQKQAEELDRKLQQDKADLSAQSTARKKQEADAWKRGDKISKGLLFGFLGFIAVAFILMALLNSILPALTMGKSYKTAEENKPDLALCFKAISDYDQLKSDAERLVLKSEDGYTFDNAELVDAYVISPVTTQTDRNSLLLFYKVDGTFGSDSEDSSVYRVVCLNNVGTDGNEITDDNLIGDSVVLSDSIVKKCFLSEEDAFNKLVTPFADHNKYWIETMNMD